MVLSYLRFAAGKLGITFATDVETASDIADEYNLAGVPAAVVSHKTNAVERVEVLGRFKRRDILQLVNVDLFGEISVMSKRDLLSTSVLTLVVCFVLFNVVYEQFVANDALAEKYAERQRRNGLQMMEEEQSQELVRSTTEAALEELRANPKFKKHMAKREKQPRDDDFEPEEFDEANMEQILENIDKELSQNYH